MLVRHSWPVALVAPFVVACSGEPSVDAVPGCKLSPLGDATKPIELELQSLDPSKVAHDLADGGSVAMIVPPQGGWVIFVGARATNIDPCAVQLSGVLTDPESKQVRIDERTTNLKPTGDGWGGPIDGDISTVSNIPVCPNQWASADLFGNPFELTVTLSDRHERSASKTIKVVPECAEPHFKASCSCQCQKDYILGEACVPGS
jgi:hypothetical protein